MIFQMLILEMNKINCKSNLNKFNMGIQKNQKNNHPMIKFKTITIIMKMYQNKK